MSDSVKKIVLLLGVILFLVLVGCYFKKKSTQIMAPAPSGIHGTYSSNSPRNYELNKSKDSVIAIFERNGLSIKTGKLNDYDAPWDSLRYGINKFPCDKDIIEAYIEFAKSGASFKILWFNGSPTDDERIYNLRVEKYYYCFESFLKANNLIH